MSRLVVVVVGGGVSYTGGGGSLTRPVMESVCSFGGQGVSRNMLESVSSFAGCGASLTRLVLETDWSFVGGEVLLHAPCLNLFGRMSDRESILHAPFSHLSL